MTNKIVLRTIQEFMSGYTPVYQPIYPLLMGKAQSYSQEVGRMDFRRVNTIGDLFAKVITPKDTEIQQIGVNEKIKSFKKYFLANQFTISAMQDRQGIEDVVAQVLDAHQLQMDQLVLFGEGTSTSTMLNNGLFWSNDPNYTLNVSAETLSTPAALYTSVRKSTLLADQVAGRKLLIFYGTDTLPIVDSLHSSYPSPFVSVLKEALGANYSIAKMPPALCPASTNGWIIVNLDQVKLHYTAAPSLKDQGINNEKMYAWFNFLMGSSMLEVLALNGVVRQVAST